MYGRNQCNKTNTFEILTFDSSSKGIEYSPSSSLNYSPNATWNFIHEARRRGRENRSAIFQQGTSRTNERIRMNTCRTMDWLARARNDFIIYLGHDRFQCANRNCLLRRSGVVNVASSSSRREWQFVSPIKLIASVRDWSRCSDRATSLLRALHDPAWSSKRMMAVQVSVRVLERRKAREETRFDSIDLYPLIFELHDNFSIDSIDFRCWKFEERNTHNSRRNGISRNIWLLAFDGA